jgi:hypothetical protein
MRRIARWGAVDDACELENRDAAGGLRDGDRLYGRRAVAKLACLVDRSEMRTVILCLVVGFIGCSVEPDSAKEVVDVGQVVSAKVSPEGWRLTYIECEKGTFVVRGINSIFTHRQASVRIMASGRRMLVIDGDRFQYDID